MLGLDKESENQRKPSPLPKARWSQCKLGNHSFHQR